MFRAKCKANQELGNRRRVHTPMRRRSTHIVQPRRFDARAGGGDPFRNAVYCRGAGRTGRYVVVRLLPIIFSPKRSESRHRYIVRYEHAAIEASPVQCRPVWTMDCRHSRRSPDRWTIAHYHRQAGYDNPCARLKVRACTLCGAPE